MLRVGLVLTRLIFPWYLRFLFRMPWWLFGILAMLWAAIAAGVIVSYRADIARADAAMAGPPPAVTQVDDLGPGAITEAKQELQVSGIWRQDVGIRPVKVGGIQRDVVVLEGTDPQGPIVIAVLERGDGEGLPVEALKTGGTLTVFGLTDLPGQKLPLDSMTLARQDLDGRPIVVLAPANMSRGDLYSIERSRANGGAIIILGVTVIVFLFPTIGFWRSRRRRKASPEIRVDRAPAVPEPIKAGPTPLVKSPRKLTDERFKDSPIVTNRGWFR
jgi:hypothetical protein